MNRIHGEKFKFSYVGRDCSRKNHALNLNRMKRGMLLTFWFQLYDDCRDSIFLQWFPKTDEWQWFSDTNYKSDFNRDRIARCLGLTTS